MSPPKAPILIVIVAPSGAGKTTLCELLVERFPNLVYSVSCTTRNARGREKEGSDYFFVSVDEFQRRVEDGAFLEHAIVHGHCEFEVLDHGPGFGNLNDAFVPFYTTKDKGMGIGLALCKQIVNSHFGRVTLENRQDGSGACVRISLPLRQATKRSAVQTH